MDEINEETSNISQLPADNGVSTKDTQFQDACVKLLPPPHHSKLFKTPLAAKALTPMQSRVSPSDILPDGVVPDSLSGLSTSWERVSSLPLATSSTPTSEAGPASEVPRKQPQTKERDGWLFKVCSNPSPLGTLPLWN